MKAIIFSGPTLTSCHIKHLSSATCRPPAAQGDILSAVKGGFQIIALVDGYFGWTRSVWHKEILWAMSNGVHVLGSSSMGALRAAELDIFGMTGIGKVYRGYRDGVIEDDDEVAVIHAPEEVNFQLLSDAMVDIRATIHRAATRGLITIDQANNLQVIAKSMHYTQRTFLSLNQHPSLQSLSRRELSKITIALEKCQFSQKSHDALELVEHVNQLIHEGTPREPPLFDFKMTRAWEAALNEQKLPNAEISAYPFNYLTKGESI